MTARLARWAAKVLAVIVTITVAGYLFGIAYDYFFGLARLARPSARGD